MNRDYILENDIIGRYVAGELSEKEAEQFEFAFFQNEELAALVEAEQTLQREFQARSHGDSSSNGTGDRRMVRHNRWIAVAAAILVATVLPLFHFFGDRTVEPFTLSAIAPVGVDAMTHFESGERGSAGLTTIAIPDQPDDTIVLSFPIDVDEPLQLSLMYEGDIDPIWTFDWQPINPSTERLFLRIAASELYPGNYVLSVQRVGDDVPLTAFQFRATREVP